ncbi:MAG: protein FxsA [Nocardioidaceae bacterium]|jgi:UPF0716 protein FxsA|nr:protein FxsA [Nocardioidaceae bacterium]
MRRRLPWWVLGLLFVVVPIAELAILIQLGQLVGPWWTILILLADAALGTWLVKHEGRRAWRGLQEALASHRMPATELADGALVLVGGTLLITPGFLSDIAGLFCILPLTRPLARRMLTRVITRRLALMDFRAAPAEGSPFAAPWTGTPSGSQRSSTAPRGRGEVIQGEVIDDEA